MSKIPPLLVLSSLLVAAVGARAGEDPSELAAPPPPAPAPDAPDTPDAPIEPTPSEAPLAPATGDQEPAQEPAPPSAPLEDPLATCRALVVDSRLDDALHCVRELLNDEGAAPELHRRARALRDLITAWGRHLDAPAPPAAMPAAEAQAQAQAQVKVSELVDAISAEASVHGAVGGAGAGFLLAASVASATRASEADTLPWLIAAPAVGGVVGAAGGFGLARALRPEAGDLRLATSTMWMGATQGFFLQWIVFHESPDVGATPMRFGTILGGGALGLGAGAALAPLVDVDDGDVAVAHSAALWGGVLTTIGISGASSMLGGVPFPVVVAVLAGSVGVPYAAALACHSLIDIERWPSFLIDGGGAAGLLIAGAFLSVSAGALQPSAPVVAGVLGVGAAAGIAVGATAAWMVSSAVRKEAHARAGDDEGVE
ncbi:MAG: hypothetical protein IT383_04655 [Deltaproteobacteria bacterium]|nr:hypothetical protein [Deltaproteobacteria bacterium]